LGSLLVDAVKFFCDSSCQNFCLVCCLMSRKRISSVCTRTITGNIRHSHFLSEVIADDNMGSPCLT
jgi:hypothetical protein